MGPCLQQHAWVTKHKDIVGALYAYEIIFVDLSCLVSSVSGFPINFRSYSTFEFLYVGQTLSCECALVALTLRRQSTDHDALAITNRFMHLITTRLCCCKSFTRLGRVVSAETLTNLHLHRRYLCYTGCLKNEGNTYVC